MKKPTIRIYDCETGETVDREMNAAEFAQYEIEQETLRTKQAEAEAKATAKAALLVKLGITQAEAELLLA
ncbi:hypothetical protein UFOVP1142_4 [uncultured Caudovirales phage]|uniref:Uncharacterized protein n=1 Tax=uncultured Caudovirales phage TaxID=2100421 RepID=A0A6J5QU05_9CAUD|nr:hypothetical protein UFOVP1142_4 [uncultured Caudovirales phage]